jgi:hypothetical protein
MNIRLLASLLLLLFSHAAAGPFVPSTLLPPSRSLPVPQSPRHPLSALRTIVSDTLQIEARLPSELAITVESGQPESDRVEIRGVATDEESGDYYVIERLAFSRFERFDDQQAVFAREIELAASQGDSIAKYADTLHRGDPAVELEIVTEGVQAVRRVRLVLHGAYLYRFIVAMPRAGAYSARTEEIFSSIKLTGPKGGDLYAGKLGSIIAALESHDDLLRENARTVLWRMNFDRKEKQQIYDILKRPRADDDREKESLRFQLLHALLDNVDSTDMPMLRKIYPTIANLPYHRETFRLLLAEIATGESLRWLADLLVAETVVPEDFTSMLTWLEFDISSARYLFPKVLPLLEHPVYREGLLRYLNSALAEGSVETSAIVPQRQWILEAIGNSVEESRVDPRLRQAAIVGIQLLEKLPVDEATITLLRSLSNDADRQLAYAALLALLRLGQTADAPMLERIAASPRYRLDLYRELQQIGSAELFPRRYLTQRAISESALVEWLASDYERAPDSIVLAATREVTVEGEQRRAYLFKVLYRSADLDSGLDERWTVGIGSLQPLDPKAIDFTDSHAISFGNPVESMSVDRHIRVLLE